MPPFSAAKLEQKTSAPNLADRFLVPPFTVLSAREGYWQARKRQWIHMGIQSEIGRGEALTFDTGLHPYDGGGDSPSLRADAKLDSGEGRDDGLTWNTGGDLDGYRHGKNMSGRKKANATPGGSPFPAANQKGRRAMESGHTIRGDGRGRALRALDSGDGRDDDLLYKSQNRLNEIMSQRRNVDGQLEGGISGTSIFDPVLCELVYRWFSAPGARILDPFAGGSVRGVVASVLQRHYTGVDLRLEQCQANAAQGIKLCEPQWMPTWFCGDSVEYLPIIEPGIEYDLGFSCPPYLDLEVYSDDPRDLSTMEFEKFMDVYREIIRQMALRLKDNRFAAFVVGDVRDKNGIYRNFPALTIDAFEKAGLRYYNECILVTAVGSLPIRAGKAFVRSRKLGRTHQNVIFGVKGDPMKAAEACGQADADIQTLREASLFASTEEG